MFSRIKFLFSKKPFLYMADGLGIKPLSYNPFSDNLYVRFSQFGSVTHWSQIMRAEYISYLILSCKK